MNMYQGSVDSFFDPPSLDFLSVPIASLRRSPRMATSSALTRSFSLAAASGACSVMPAASSFSRRLERITCSRL